MTYPARLGGEPFSVNHGATALVIACGADIGRRRSVACHGARTIFCDGDTSQGICVHLSITTVAKCTNFSELEKLVAPPLRLTDLIAERVLGDLARVGLEFGWVHRRTRLVGGRVRRIERQPHSI